MIHALHIDGRASFALLGRVLGVSTQTAARRYRRLRENGIVRVLVVPGPAAPGISWIVRIGVRPGHAERIAEAIARRPDMSWVSITPAGAEVLCQTRPTTSTQLDTLMLQRLPGTGEVTAITAQAIAHVYAGDNKQEWSALADPLDPSQEAAIRDSADPGTADDSATLQREDAALADLLGRDGRASYTELAAAAGITPARAAQRLHAMLTTGLLSVEVEVTVAALGFPLRAWIWIRLPPADLNPVGDAISRLPDTGFAVATTGTANLILVAICRDIADLHRYVTTELAAFPTAEILETLPIIRQVKQERSLPADGRLPTPQTPETSE